MSPWRVRYTQLTYNTTDRTYDVLLMFRPPCTCISNTSQSSQALRCRSVLRHVGPLFAPSNIGNAVADRGRIPFTNFMSLGRCTSADSLSQVRCNISLEDQSRSFTLRCHRGEVPRNGHQLDPESIGSLALAFRISRGSFSPGKSHEICSLTRYTVTVTVIRNQAPNAHAVAPEHEEWEDCLDLWSQPAKCMGMESMMADEAPAVSTSQPISIPAAIPAPQPEAPTPAAPVPDHPRPHAHTNDAADQQRHLTSTRSDLSELTECSLDRAPSPTSHLPEMPMPYTKKVRALVPSHAHPPYTRPTRTCFSSAPSRLPSAYPSPLQPVATHKPVRCQPPSDSNRRRPIPAVRYQPPSHSNRPIPVPLQPPAPPATNPPRHPLTPKLTRLACSPRIAGYPRAGALELDSGSRVGPNTQRHRREPRRGGGCGGCSGGAGSASGDPRVHNGGQCDTFGQGGGAPNEPHPPQRAYRARARPRREPCTRQRAPHPRPPVGGYRADTRSAHAIGACAWQMAPSGPLKLLPFPPVVAGWGCGNNQVAERRRRPQPAWGFTHPLLLRELA
eukprot:843904-Prorocentrum_minimum.AAC.1